MSYIISNKAGIIAYDSVAINHKQRIRITISQLSYRTKQRIKAFSLNGVWHVF